MDTIDRGRTNPAPEKQVSPAIRPAPGMRVSHFVIVLIVLGLVGGLGWWIWIHPAKQVQRGPRFAAHAGMPVAAATANLGDMPIRLTALGTVTPLSTVTVRPQVSGPLIEVDFREGQKVNKGDVLARIDPRPYQLTLDQAQAQLVRDQAQLKNAELDLERYRTLVSQNSIARQQRDTQEALVAQYQGTIQSDQALIGTAKLNLSYANIVAPSSGRTGLRLVDPGNIVSTTDTTGLVVITQTQPISVMFTVPEDQVPAIMQRMRQGATLPVTAFDRGRTRALATGVVTTVDNQIDATTGTVKLRATFANEDEGLFPNQFVNIDLLVDTVHDAVVVPTAGVQHGAPGDFVYRIDREHNTVAVVPVQLGITDGDHVALAKGLSNGDLIVVDGADKLREGATITMPDTAGGASTGTPSSAPAAGDPNTHRRPHPDGAPADRSPGEHHQRPNAPGQATPSAAPSSAP